MHVSVQFHHPPIKTVGVCKNTENWLKNANDPCDLGFDLVTLRVFHVLELDYTYLQTKYEQDIPSDQKFSRGLLGA